MIKEFFKEKRPHRGMTYEQYLEFMRKAFQETDPNGANRQVQSRRRYIELNYQRSTRIQDTYTVPDDLRATLEQITEPQLWMVLTEPWCGDSAQCLPYIAKFAECSPSIDLRILLRDQNLDIMDQYLTDGKRGIPKLVVFDEQGHERLHWGPRPQPAAKLFQKERTAGLSKDAIMEKLHLWYARNRGEALEAEFRQILSELVGCPTHY